MPDRFSLTRQERAKLGKPLDPSVAMLGPRHGVSSPSQSNRDETSISGNRRPSSFGDTEDRQTKRKKVEPEREVKTIFEKFEAQLKTFRDTFSGRNEKDYFLDPVNSVATQLYVSLEQTSDNTKSEVVQEAIMDFFEIAADILKGICMMSNMAISRMAIDVVVKILTPISDAIIRMEIEDNTGTSISPFIDMGLLILEELFGKLDNGSDESGMPELVSICKVPMWTIFIRLNERDHPMASLFGLAHALISETACYMKEFYLDTPREYIDGPMDIASAIIFEIHGRIEEGTTAENHNSTFIRLTSALIGLSLHKMIDGISHGVLEERVSNRLFHLLSLIHLFIPACVGQFDEKAKSSEKFSFLKICNIIFGQIGKQQVPTMYGVQVPRLFSFFQILLSFGFPEHYEKHMSQLLCLPVLGSGKSPLALKEKTASTETPPYDMEFILTASFAAIYNELILDLIGGYYAQILEANTISALVQIIHTMLTIVIDKRDEAEMAPFDLPSPETLHRFMIYFGALSKMHPYDKKLNARIETGNVSYPKIPRSKRTESIRQFVRGYADFQAKYKGSKGDGSHVKPSGSKTENMKQSFKPLIKFLHDGHASIPVDDAEDEVVTFDPSLPLEQRASAIIIFIGLKSGFVLPSIDERDEIIKNQLDAWVKDLTTNHNTGEGSDDDSDQFFDRDTDVETD